MDEVNNVNNRGGFVIDPDLFARYMDGFWAYKEGRIEDVDPEVLADLVRVFPTGEFGFMEAELLKQPPSTEVGALVRTEEGIRKLRKAKREFWEKGLGVSDVEELLVPKFDEKLGEYSLVSAEEGFYGEGEEFDISGLLARATAEKKGKKKILITPSDYLQAWVNVLPEDKQTEFLNQYWSLRAQGLEDEEAVEQVMEKMGMELGELEQVLIKVANEYRKRPDADPSVIDELTETYNAILAVKGDPRLAPTIYRSFFQTGEIEGEWWNVIVFREIGKLFEGIADLMDRDQIIESGFLRFFQKDKYNQILKRVQEEGIENLPLEDQITYLIGIKKDLQKYIQYGTWDKVLMGLGSITDFAVTTIGASAAKLPANAAAKVLPKLNKLSQIRYGSLVAKPLELAIKNPEVFTTVAIKSTPELVENAVGHVGIVETEEGQKLVQLLDEGSSFTEAITKYGLSAITESIIENYGGEWAVKVLGVPMANKLAKVKILEKWLAKRGIKKIAGSTYELAKKIGWHGVIGEVIEEEMSLIKDNLLQYGPKGIINYLAQFPLITKAGAERVFVNTVTTGIFGGFTSIVSRGGQLILDAQNRPKEVVGLNVDRELLYMHPTFQFIKEGEDISKFGDYSEVVNRLLGVENIENVVEAIPDMLKKQVKNPKPIMERLKQLSDYLLDHEEQLKRYKEYKTLPEWMKKEFGTISFKTFVTQKAEELRQQLTDEDAIALEIAAIEDQYRALKANATSQKERDRLELERKRKIERIKKTGERLQAKIAKRLTEVAELLDEVDKTIESITIPTNQLDSSYPAWVLQSAYVFADYLLGNITKDQLTKTLAVIDTVLVNKSLPPLFEPITRELVRARTATKKEKTTTEEGEVQEQTTTVSLLTRNVTTLDIRLYASALMEDKTAFVNTVGFVVKDLHNILEKSGKLEPAIKEVFKEAVDKIRQELVFNADKYMDILKKRYNRALKRGIPLTSVIGEILDANGIRDTAFMLLDTIRARYYAIAVFMGSVKLEELEPQLQTRVKRILPLLKRTYQKDKKSIGKLIQRKADLGNALNSAYRLLSYVSMITEPPRIHTKISPDDAEAGLPNIELDQLLLLIKKHLGINYDVRYATNLLKNRNALGILDNANRTIFIDSSLRTNRRLTTHIILHELAHDLLINDPEFRSMRVHLQRELGHFDGLVRFVRDNLDAIRKYLKQVPRTKDPRFYLLTKLGKLKSGDPRWVALFSDLVHASLYSTRVIFDDVKKSKEAFLDRFTKANHIELVNELLADSLYLFFTRPMQLAQLAPTMYEFFARELENERNRKFREMYIDLFKIVRDNDYWGAGVLRTLSQAGLFSDMLVYLVAQKRRNQGMLDSLLYHFVDTWAPLERKVWKHLKEVSSKFGDEEFIKLRERDVKQQLLTLRSYARFKSVQDYYLKPLVQELDEILKTDNPVTHIALRRLIGERLLLERVAADVNFENRPGPLGLTKERAEELLKDENWARHFENAINSLPRDVQEELRAIFPERLMRAKEWKSKLLDQLLDYSVEAGILTKERAEELRQHKEYIRLQRLTKVFKDYNVLDDEVIGSLDLHTDPLAATLSLFANTIHFGELNKAKRALIKLARMIQLARPSFGAKGVPLSLQNIGWTRIKVMEDGKLEEYWIDKTLLEGFDAIHQRLMPIAEKVGSFTINLIWTWNVTRRAFNLVKDMLNAMSVGLGLAANGNISLTRLFVRYMSNLMKLTEIAKGDHKVLKALQKAGQLPSLQIEDWKVASPVQSYKTLDQYFYKYTENRNIKEIERLLKLAKKGDRWGYLTLKGVFGTDNLQEIEEYVKSYREVAKLDLGKLSAIYSFVDDILNSLEYLPKIAFYEALQDQIKGGKAKLTDYDVYEIITKYVGNPDTLGARARWSRTLGIIFPFYQTQVNATRYLIEALRDKRINNGAYLATLFLLVVPQLIYYLAKYGVLDKIACDLWGKDKDFKCQYFKNLYTEMSEQSHIYSILMPIIWWKNEEGYHKWLALPKPVSAVILSKFLNPAIKLAAVQYGLSVYKPESKEYKELQKEYNTFMQSLMDEGVADLVSGEILPGLNPLIEDFIAWLQFLRGQEPIDSFTKRRIVTKDEIEFNTKKAFLKMFTWSIDNLGAENIFKVQTLTELEDIDPEQKMKYLWEHAVFRNTMRRVIKDGGFGKRSLVYEQMLEAKRLKKMANTERSQKLDKFANKVVFDMDYYPNGNPQRFERLWQQAVVEVFGKPYDQLPAYQKAEARGLKKRLQVAIVERLDNRYNKLNKITDKVAFYLYNTTITAMRMGLEKKVPMETLRTAKSDLGPRQYKRYIAALYELGFINEKFIKSLWKEEPEMVEKLFSEK